jgi:hypothetical protein
MIDVENRWPSYFQKVNCLSFSHFATRRIEYASQTAVFGDIATTKLSDLALPQRDIDRLEQMVSSRDPSLRLRSRLRSSEQIAGHEDGVLKQPAAVRTCSHEETLRWRDEIYRPEIRAWPSLSSRNT